MLSPYADHGLTPIDEEGLHDLMNGAAILGAGGGGSLDEARHYLGLALAAGPPPLVPISSLAPASIVAFPCRLGAVTSPDLSKEPPIQMALSHLNSAGIQIAAMGAVELGAVNVLLASYAAAMAGVPLLDADPRGRAVPEVTQSAFAVHDVPMGRVIAASPSGEVFEMNSLSSDSRAEEVLRALATVCGNDLSIIDRPMPLKTVAPGLMAGTLSRAKTAGAIWRKARSDGKDVAIAVATALGGDVLFRGRIIKGGGEDRDGFTEGEVHLQGKSEKSQAEEFVKVIFKNENMAAIYGDGKVLATVPEVIVLFREDNGDLVLNPEFESGCDVALVVLPAPSVFLTKRGLELFGPTYAGVPGKFRSALREKGQTKGHL